MYRTIVVGLLIFGMSFFAYAEGEFRDSVLVEEVQIDAPRKKHFIEGYNYKEITDKLLKNFANRTLGELLQYSSGLNIRSNGSPGALSSISFRGLGSSQTQVNWNGFPVNSVTLGSADLSNIPLASGQSVGIATGVAGASYGSGAIGGAINIDWKSNQTDAPNALINLATGSMGTFKGAAGYQVQASKLQLSGTVWGDISDGDFTYYDAIKQDEFKRQNADYHQMGVQQYFSFKNSNYSELKGGIWAQAKDLNLPSIEGASLDNYENQKDSTLRIFLHYKKLFTIGVLNAKAAWFYADQHYIKKTKPDDDFYATESRIKSKTWFADGSYRVYLPYHLSFDFGFAYQYTTAIVDAYGGDQHEQVLGLIPGLKYDNKALKVNLLVRKDWANTVNSNVLINLGVDYELIQNQLNVRGAYSQKFRRPTFNDLYWIPGGNPDLQPESGYSIETGLVYKKQSDLFGLFSFDLGFYYSPIDNMIVWRPEGATWYANNYRNVLSRGIDFRLDHSITGSALNWHNVISVSYNKATIESSADGRNEGRPLYYAPEWISNVNSSISHNSGYSLDFGFRTASKSYFDDSKKYLDPYWIINLNLAKEINFGKNKFATMINVDNLFNHRYQTVRSYPMPGRIWQVNLKYSFNN
ncbi:TonB-dependent receptor [Carboxylicivirga linearis]|uniref:TonB-dependent receptor n=1 Tax=Carboxylicivirga linearis TaxID=1628157 RepID=A0ABS5JRA8_9BACT|nr:TonB-dependent receptor [Carboxylicivirga linearis]MBS2097435.1 TonB-dependent receptor [Carboxylicivirga linearis]